MEKWTGIERRHAKNIWRLVTRILTLASWAFFIFAMIISHYAAPETSYGWLQYHHIEVRSGWLSPLTNYLLAILWFSAFMSILSLVIEQFRTRRKQDRKHFNLIMLIIIIIAWSAYIVFHLNYL